MGISIKWECYKVNEGIGTLTGDCFAFGSFRPSKESSFSPSKNK